MLLARLLDSPSIFLQFPLQLALLLDPPASLSLHTLASCHYLPLPMSLLRVLSKLSRHINPRPSYRPYSPSLIYSRNYLPHHGPPPVTHAAAVTYNSYFSHLHPLLSVIVPLSPSLSHFYFTLAPHPTAASFH